MKASVKDRQRARVTDTVRDRRDDRRESNGGKLEKEENFPAMDRVILSLDEKAR